VEEHRKIKAAAQQQQKKASRKKTNKRQNERGRNKTDDDDFIFDTIFFHLFKTECPFSALFKDGFFTISVFA